MNFIKVNAKFHIVMIISETTDIIIGIIVNLITQEPFSLLSSSSLVLGGILILLIIVHIACSIAQHNSSSTIKSKKLQKAFQEHGGYDALAEEMISCVKDRDFRSFKSIKKMAEFVER